MRFQPQVPELRQSGFMRLRDGIWEHIKTGKLTGNDMNVWLTLNHFAKWDSGICETTAASIAGAWQHLNDAENTKKVVQNSMQRLRKNGFILYDNKQGHRGVYPVLIDKYEPTVGALVGWQLNAKETKDLANPMFDYVSPTSYSQAYGDEAVKEAVNGVVNGAVMVVVKGAVEVVVTRPLLDITRMYIQTFKDF